MNIQYSQLIRKSVGGYDPEKLFELALRKHCDQKYEEAFELYHLAAAMGDSDGLCNIAYCYLKGKGVGKDVELAMAYYQLAADKGNEGALKKLASIYKDGYDMIAPDYEKAVEYFKKSLKYRNSSLPQQYLEMAQAHMPGGRRDTDLSMAYAYLRAAFKTYEEETQYGIYEHQEEMKEIQAMMNQSCYDAYRDQ